MNDYNEVDSFAAHWLRELIRVGLIPAGDVDERSIEDVLPTELKPYRQFYKAQREAQCDHLKLAAMLV